MLALGVVFGCAAACAAATLSDDDRSGTAGSPTRAFRLDFDSEIVRLRVLQDSLEVEGVYRFLCRPSTSRTARLLYPYPVDSLMGGARTVALEARGPSGHWQAIDFVEAPGYPGATWIVPTDWDDTLEVRTVYRQRLLRNYARYIVTSTRRWRRPLRSARFEIRLPADSHPASFSYPFEKCGGDQAGCYVYEAMDFMPDRDIIVEWSR